MQIVSMYKGYSGYYAYCMYMTGLTWEYQFAVTKSNCLPLHFSISWDLELKSPHHCGH